MEAKEDVITHARPTVILITVSPPGWPSFNSFPSSLHHAFKLSSPLNLFLSKKEAVRLIGRSMGFWKGILKPQAGLWFWLKGSNGTKQWFIFPFFLCLPPLFVHFTNFSKFWIIKRRWDSFSSSFSFVLELDKEEKLKVIFFFLGKKMLEKSRKFPFGKGRNKFKADKWVRNGLENTWKKEWKRSSSSRRNYACISVASKLETHFVHQRTLIS